MKLRSPNRLSPYVGLLKIYQSIFLAILFLVAGCYSDQTGKSVKISKHKTDTLITSSDSLKFTYLPFLKGVWVLANYVSDIQKTKSPQKSYKMLEGLSSLTISGEGKGDSTGVVAFLNNHEGGADFMMYFQLDAKTKTLLTNNIDYENKGNYYTIGYQILKGDTVLFLYHYSKKGLLIDLAKYAKLKMPIHENTYGSEVEFIVNQMLFAGIYVSTDHSGADEKITFTKDGIISGFKNFKSYVIATDFAVREPGDYEGDRIYFDDKFDPDYYKFQFSGDTLILEKDKVVSRFKKEL